MIIGTRTKRTIVLLRSLSEVYSIIVIKCRLRRQELGTVPKSKYNRYECDHNLIKMNGVVLR